MEYIVATVPRSGSSLLCGLLQSNGIGYPREHFAPHSGIFAEAIKRKEPTERFLAEILQTERQNGIWGTKIMGDWLPIMSAHMEARRGSWQEGIDSLFPKAKYVFLIREDLIGQAISFSRAALSGEWYQRGDSESRKWKGSIPPLHIHGSLLHLLGVENNWQNYFAHLKLDFLPLTYESLTEDLFGTLDKFATHLGLTAPRQWDTTSYIGVQRDEQTERYRKDYLESGLLDSLTSRLSGLKERG